ncbi:hypothetical protein [Acaryochloris sp. IP29b_bin.137]|uniref:hypothetical protein n=1 Tax=Acaryochloris sp. IP29b_bin.137 TaxID=2969217 RepID=UPI00262B9E77|nr:hypothetical protein [Acaryochloris sp. IP29b_bin.137]
MNQAHTEDETLQQLAIQAQKSPPQSPERHQCLQQLVSDILHSGKLGHPAIGNYPREVYEELYNEALQRTLIKVCTKIDQYNCAHPVMAWVNHSLKYTFIDVEQSRYRHGMTYIAGSMKNQILGCSLDDLDHPPPTPNRDDQSDADRLRQFLVEDPEGCLRKVYVRNRPEITFQRVAIAIYVEDQSWTQLSESLDISLPTLHSFFNRNLQKLKPYFKKYILP